MLPKPENVKQDTKSYFVINKKINKTSKQTKLNTKKTKQSAVQAY